MCEQGDLLQERLKTHFAALDRVRRRNRVVFALEHGLSSDDIRSPAGRESGSV
jgi:hypothetical protein